VGIGVTIRVHPIPLGVGPTSVSIPMQPQQGLTIFLVFRGAFHVFVNGSRFSVGFLLVSNFL
jgi:hypothetical protein